MKDNTGKVIENASSLVEKIGTTAIDIFDASKKVVIDAIDQYGSQAIEAVLWVVRIDAIQTLIVALFWCILAIWIFNKSLKNFKKYENSNFDSDMPIVWFISMFLCVVVLGFNLKPILNVWNYVAIAKPEIYLVKQVVDIVKNKAEVGKNN